MALAMQRRHSTGNGVFMGRRRRRNPFAAGDVASGLLELLDLIWGVARLVVRVPALLLRLLD